VRRRPPDIPLVSREAWRPSRGGLLTFQTHPRAAPGRGVSRGSGGLEASHVPALREPPPAPFGRWGRAEHTPPLRAGESPGRRPSPPPPLAGRPRPQGRGRAASGKKVSPGLGSSGETFSPPAYRPLGGRPIGRGEGGAGG